MGKFFSTTGLKQEQPEADNCFQVKKRRLHFSLSEKSKKPGTCYKPKIENWEKKLRGNRRNNLGNQRNTMGNCGLFNSYNALGGERA